MKNDFERAYPPISDYGIIGAMHTCALVSKAGSIDWLCLPSFDSPSVFCRMLDWHKGGYFQIRPRNITGVERRYLPSTNILETTFTTETGTARLTDFMAAYPADDIRTEDGNKFELPDGVTLVLPSADHHVPPMDEMLKPLYAQLHQKVVRIFECIDGEIEYDLDCAPRFDYGSVVPHLALIEPNDDGTAEHGFARGGGTAMSLYSSVPLTATDHEFHASGRLTAGERVHAAVAHQPYFLPVAEDLNPDVLDELFKQTEEFWIEWADQCTYEGEYRDDVLRSALALKALTYEPSGALLAAATTSLPEEPAGERNWDYRFTWLRDATFSLEALHNLGYTEEARAFKRWIEWTAAHPEDLQIMYGLRGERWLTEVELPLEGYRWSAPVRVGNGAFDQFQLDIYGEVLDSAYIYRSLISEETTPDYWEFLASVVDYVTEIWRMPDAGIWETRGGYRHFVYSKVMCWVALDRGIKIAQELGEAESGKAFYDITDEQIARWERIRDEIRADVLANGYDPNYSTDHGAFVQHYGSKVLDASVLMLPLVGFIDAKDPMMKSTIEAIQKDLTSPQGFV
ncbi:MAG: glycoside hydrolase family 15 protein, partial [Chloroflexota bacterium]